MPLPPSFSWGTDENIDDTPIGYVKNFVESFFKNAQNPTFTLPAAGHALVDFGRGVLNTSTSLANSVADIFNPTGSFSSTPVPDFLKPVYGTDHIKTAGEQLLDMENSLRSSPAFQGFINSAAQNPIVQKTGLSKVVTSSSLPTSLAFFGVLGDEAMNTLGIGWGGDGELIRKIAGEKSAEAIGSLLRTRGISGEVADHFAPALADTANEGDIKGILNAMKGMDHAATIGEHGSPEATTALDDAILHPEAQADWEQTFQERHGEYGQKIGELQQEAAASSGPQKKMLLDQIAGLEQKQGALEDEWVHKWATPGSEHLPPEYIEPDITLPRAEGAPTPEVPATPDPEKLARARAALEDFSKKETRYPDTVKEGSTVGEVPLSRFDGEDIVASQNTVDAAGVKTWEKRIENGERPRVVVDYSERRGGPVIVDGHTRLTAYKNLGIQDIPVVDNSGGRVLGEGTPVGDHIAEENKPMLRSDAPVGEELPDELKSLELAADTQNEWKYALRGNTVEEAKVEDDLDRIFADLHGIKVSDLPDGTLTAEDLSNARAQYEITRDAMLDHPGRALMKFVSRESGELPEVKGRSMNERVGVNGRALKDTRGVWNKAGDDIFQDLVGQEKSHQGDVVVAQEMVDDYKQLRDTVKEYEEGVRSVRKAIILDKKRNQFVDQAKRALAAKLVKDTRALGNLVNAGAEAGRSEGVARGKSLIAEMTRKLKERRLDISRIQRQSGLSDRQFSRIMGRKDPRFMTDAEYKVYAKGLTDRANSLRQATDKYGAFNSPAMTLEEQLAADKGTWRGLVKGYYNKLPKGRVKADFLDYLSTPEFVLERLGLGRGAEMLHDATNSYRSTLTEEIDKVKAWKARAGNRPFAATRIFRWLDGQEKEVFPEMSAEEHAVAVEIRGYLRDWAARLHLPDDSRIAKYITHLFEPDKGVMKEGEDIFDDPELAILMQDKPAGTVYDPFLQERLGKKGYKEDVWAALDAYIKRAARKEAYDPVLDQITEAAGRMNEETYKYVTNLTHRINMRPTELDKMLDNFFKYRLGIKKMGPRPVAFISQKLRAGFYRGLLGLNVSSALRNLSQGANTYAKLGEKYTVIGYAKLMARLATGRLGELHDTGILSDNLIQDRKVGIYQSFLQKADPVLFGMFDLAEKINRGSAYFGAKAKALDKGLPEEEAVKYAQRIVRETQFAFGAVDTPVALASDLAKTVTQLQTYNLKQIEFMARMVKNKEYAGLVRYTVASLAFVYSIGKMFGMTVGQLLPSVGLGGGPTVTALGAIPGLFADNAQDRAAAQKTLTNAAISRIPAGAQLKKTIQGVETVKAGGDYTPTGKTRFEVMPSTEAYLRAALFGKSGLPEAQAYYDRLNKAGVKGSNTTTPSGGLPPAF